MNTVTTTALTSSLLLSAAQRQVSSESLSQLERQLESSRIGIYGSETKGL